MPRTGDLKLVCDAIQQTPIRRGNKARLVALSGIDSSGKGHVAAKLVSMLGPAGGRVALIGVDGWLNLPEVRFSKTDPGGHFYRNGLRFEEMFSQLVDPLIRDGSVEVVADFAEETAHSYRKEHYLFQEVDTVLLEGVFLLRRDLRVRYDLKLWVESSFETALRRAIARGQEGLPPSETIAAFESIYFPAQRVHFAEDAPRASADLIIDNED